MLLPTFCSYNLPGTRKWELRADAVAYIYPLLSISLKYKIVTSLAKKMCVSLVSLAFNVNFFQQYSIFKMPDERNMEGKQNGLDVLYSKRQWLFCLKVNVEYLCNTQTYVYSHFNWFFVCSSIKLLSNAIICVCRAVLYWLEIALVTDVTTMLLPPADLLLGFTFKYCIFTILRSSLCIY